jgi:hypothetical protein
MITQDLTHKDAAKKDSQLYTSPLNSCRVTDIQEFYIKKSPSSPKTNHSVTLGIKFQLLPKMRRFVVYSTLKHIHDRTMYRGC